MHMARYLKHFYCINLKKGQTDHYIIMMCCFALTRQQIPYTHAAPPQKKGATKSGAGATKFFSRSHQCYQCKS